MHDILELQFFKVTFTKRCNASVSLQAEIVNEEKIIQKHINAFRSSQVNFIY